MNCRKASELSNVPAFQSEKFHVIYVIATYTGMSSQKVLATILPYFRYDDLAKTQVDAESIRDGIINDENLQLCQAPNEIIESLCSEEALAEIKEIAQILKEEGFFRSDGSAYVAAFSSLFNEKYDPYRTREMPYEDIYNLVMDNDRYENINTGAAKKMKNVIFQILEEILPPSQSGLVKFFINKMLSELQEQHFEGSYCDEWAVDLTEQETELLRCALTNLRRYHTLLQGFIEMYAGVKIF